MVWDQSNVAESVSSPPHPGQPAPNASAEDAVRSKAVTPQALPAPQPQVTAESATKSRTLAPTRAQAASPVTPPPSPAQTPGDTDGTFADVLASGGVGPLMVRLPSGSYTIGSPENEVGRDADEQPRRLISIAADLALGQTEVKRAEFNLFVQRSGDVISAEHDPTRGGQVHSSGWIWRGGASWCNPGYPQTDADPVVCTSWEGAVANTRWLSKQTSRRYVLPTEAVREYAARAGTAGPRIHRREVP